MKTHIKSSVFITLILILLVVVILVMAFPRSNAFAHSESIASDRPVSKIANCLASNTLQIKPDLERIDCGPTRYQLVNCHAGATFISRDSRLRLTVREASEGNEVLVSHDGSLRQQARNTITDCTD